MKIVNTQSSTNFKGLTVKVRTKGSRKTQMELNNFIASELACGIQGRYGFMPLIKEKTNFNKSINKIIAPNRESNQTFKLGTLRKFCGLYIFDDARDGSTYLSFSKTKVKFLILDNLRKYFKT